MAHLETLKLLISYLEQIILFLQDDSNLLARNTWILYQSIKDAQDESA